MPNITLNEPTLTYNVNDYYAEFLNFLATGNVYGQSKIMIPATKPAMGPSLLTAVVTTNVLSKLAIGTHYYVIEAVLQTPDISGLVTKETLISRELTAVVSAIHKQVNLTWQAYAGAVSYNIYRTETSGDYRNTLIANVPPSTSYVDLGAVTQFGIPLAQQVILTGSFSIAGLFDAKLFCGNKGGDPALFQELTTNPDGSFTFHISVPYGSNQFYVTDGSDKSNTIYINANNLFAFFDAMANDIKTYWQELIERINAGPHINAVDDLFDAGTRFSEISDFTSFWAVLTAVIRPSSYTDAQYRALVVIAINAYREATSYEAIKSLILAILPSWLDTSFVPLDIYNFGFRLGSGGRATAPPKFKVVRGAPFAVSLTYSWGNNAGAAVIPYVVGNIRGYIQSGTATIVPISGYMYRIVYLDGTKDVNGYFNMLTMDVNWLPTNPAGYFAMSQQTLPAGVVVLAIVEVRSGDIRWIAGQGYLGSKGMNQWVEIQTNPTADFGHEFPAMTVLNNNLFLTGGISAFSGLTTSQVFKSVDGIHWTRLFVTGAPWQIRSHHNALTFNNKLWVMEGLSTGAPFYLNDVWSSPDGLVWTQTTVAAMSNGRKDASAVVFNNKMWLMGGQDSTSAVHNDVYSSTDGVTWTLEGTAAWSARYGAGLVVFNGLMWIVGGNDGSVYLNDVWYSADGITWTLATASAPWSIRSNMGLVVLNNLIYLFSGLNATGDFWYTADGFTWVHGQDIEPDMALSGFSAVNFKNSITMTGGTVINSAPVWQWQYNGHGPYLVGPSLITDRAMLNSRGFKYSRMVIYLSTLDPAGVDYNVFVTMLTNLLEQVKPAKMTVMLGYPPNAYYTQLYNGED